MRRVCLQMAKPTRTGALEWAAMPLPELLEWVNDAAEINKKPGGR